MSEVDLSANITVYADAACICQARKDFRVCRQLGGIESENREFQAEKAFRVASRAVFLLVSVTLVGVGCSR